MKPEQTPQTHQETAMPHDNSTLTHHVTVRAMNEAITPKCLGGLVVKKFQPAPIVCVYFLVRGNEVIYIGQTANLDNRIKEHRRSIIFDEVFYLECDLYFLDRMERSMIAIFSPCLNDRHKPLSLEHREKIKQTIIDPEGSLLRALGFQRESKNSN